MTEYTIEWVMAAHAVGDDIDKDALMQSIVDNLDDEVEIRGPVRRLSGTELPYVSIGTFIVSGGLLLIELYKLLKEMDNSDVGIAKSTDGKYIFEGDFDPELVENVGANVIGTVEGDVIVAEFTSEQVREFNIQREEHQESESDKFEEYIRILIEYGGLEEEQAREVVKDEVLNREK